MAEYQRNHGMSLTQHDECMERSLEVIAEILSVKDENIFLKLRRRKSGRFGQYQKSGGEPGFSPDRPHEFMVVGNGLTFIVNLGDYLDTGLFLDHRITITRQMIRDQSIGKKVLNLFAYTESFSVYAVAGGAAEVVTVDLSKTYLDRAEKNMQLNGFAYKTKYLYIHADVKQYLETIPAGYFDLVIMDPPTFSNSKRMKDFLDIQARLLAPPKIILLKTGNCSNV